MSHWEREHYEGETQHIEGMKPIAPPPPAGDTPRTDALCNAFPTRFEQVIGIKEASAIYSLARQLERTVSVLREALEFYAAPGNWQNDTVEAGGAPVSVPHTAPALMDFGDRARDVLANPLLQQDSCSTTTTKG